MSSLHHDSGETRAARRLRIVECFCEELRADKSPRIEDYIEQVSEEERPKLLEQLICDEHFHRWHAGKLPTLTEYTNRFPEYTDSVEQGFLRLLENEEVLFALLQELGEGEFGTVFLAREKPPSDREVAVKVVKPKHLKDPQIVSRFQQEIGIAGRIEQPGIVRIYSDGRFGENGPHYVVMQYIDGQTLKKFIKDHPQRC